MMEIISDTTRKALVCARTSIEFAGMALANRVRAATDETRFSEEEINDTWDLAYKVRGELDEIMQKLEDLISGKFGEEK
jgi:uncharacterized protein YjaG (DUF416 family)